MNGTPNLGWPATGGDKIGDYYESISFNDRVHLAYAATFNEHQDIYYLTFPVGDCDNDKVLDVLQIYNGDSNDCNYNDIPDECECPAPDYFDPEPDSGVIDARVPHAYDESEPCYGFGMPDDPATSGKDESDLYPIEIDLGIEDAGDHICWLLCETPDMSESDCGSNDIDYVVDNEDGTYTIELSHGVQGGTVTTIQYLGDPSGNSYVEYIHHPADVDGSETSNSNDITEVVDCILDPGSCHDYQADVDASGTQSANDVIEVVNLLNGDGYDSWYSVNQPENDGDCPAECPPSEGDGGGGGRGESSAPDVDDGEQPFGPWFAEFLMEANPPDETAMAEFVVTVEALTGWCAEHLTSTEKTELIALLTDSEAEFANEDVKAMVPRIVAVLE